MESRIGRACVVVAAVAIGLVSPLVGRSQPEEDLFGSGTPPREYARGRGGSEDRAEPLHMQLSRAMAALRDAKEGDERANAARRLQGLLERVFRRGHQESRDSRDKHRGPSAKAPRAARSPP